MSAEYTRRPLATFTEKAFYLAEFRERTLAIACDVGGLGDAARVRSVLGELERNATRIVVLGADAATARALDATVVEAPEPRRAGAVWRALRSSPRVAVLLPRGDDFPRACRELATALRVAKLVFLDPAGALVRGDGTRISFVDLGELARLLQAPQGDATKRAPLLREVEAALRGGVAAVNVCTGDGLADELFSYAGSGTLFTAERYVSVRALGIDDFGAANDLVARGVAEGFLAPRGEAELDRVFANGYGAFVEGRHLAGICALMPHPGSASSEIASLYTLTRFLGEGIGSQLVTALCRVAAERGDRAVFACTTLERVAGFFERHGFRRVEPAEIPAEKWRDYDPQRLPKLHCLRRELDAG